MTMSAGPGGRHLKAVLQGLLIAFLWSTSWVLIKSGLQEIPPLVFAGVRYCLAFLVLLVVFAFGARKNPMPPLPRPLWMRLILMGLLLYGVAQGAMFVALKYLPAVTVNLLLSFTNLVVALVSAASIQEKPTALQWTGIGLALVGAMLYFQPAAVPAAQMLGLLAALLCVLCNAASTIIGRDVNRGGMYAPLLVTVISMGVGAAALLTTGLVVEGMPSISLRNWLFILWLAVVNTAFAYTLWNQTLRTLTAVESSVITGTMMIWIPVLAVLFIGERIGPLQLAGLIAAGAGALIVQMRRRPLANVAPANADAN